MLWWDGTLKLADQGYMPDAVVQLPRLNPNTSASWYPSECDGEIKAGCSEHGKECKR